VDDDDDDDDFVIVERRCLIYGKFESLLGSLASFIDLILDRIRNRLECHRIQ
jgi:hypothetical protein